MVFGFVGRKCGMSRIFDEAGSSIPVTVIQAEPNRITQIKTVANDGYNAVQVTTGDRRPTRVTRPQAGHFKKANCLAGRGIWEFRTEDTNDLELGAEIGVEGFYPDMVVDVTGTSKGKGYAGVVKRWNFKMQDATHGNSLSHRAPGAIGQCQTPGRVFKGKKMAGHTGNERVTVQSLKVVKVDKDRGLLLVKGAIPGATNTDVVVRPAVKFIPHNNKLAAEQSAG